MILPLVGVTRHEIVDAHWLRLHLECGHVAQRRRKFRAKNALGDFFGEDPFPKQVRCAECAARTVFDPETGAVVFACTDEDMRVGGFGPAPIDPRARHRATDEELAHLVAIVEAFNALQNIGWRNAIYAPQDNSTFLAIEAGSAGIHECSRDNQGRFWLYDGDVWPSRPLLWKPLEAEGRTVAEREEA